MISEFHLLSEKVGELAALAQSLRHENASLRQAATLLSSENAELSRRMQEAHRRVATLLENIPADSEEQAV